MTYGEGNGNPLQYSCLENPMGKGTWQATVHAVAKSQTWLKRLSTHTVLFEGKKRRGQQRMRWLDTITKSIDMNMSKLREIVKNRGVWRAAVHGITKSQTSLNNWTTTVLLGNLPFYGFPIPIPAVVIVSASLAAVGNTDMCSWIDQSDSPTANFESKAYTQTSLGASV